MVFSSAPVYLNQPNWQQQQTNHDIQQQDQAGGCVIHHNQNAHLLPAPPPPHPPQTSCSGGEVGTAGSLRPGSMAERARQANIPQPEAAQKCPRCDSTNTKFCYFNNYSRTQPRHFCKACRRYWTRGGALRSVPVGGGCRRNKRSKGSSNRSKSPATAALDHHSGGARSSTTGISPGRVDMLDHTPRQPQFPFLPSLQHLGSHPYGGSGDIVVNNDFAQSSTGGADMEFLSTGLSEQWRMQHQAFPFMGNSERPIMNASTTTTVSQLFPNFGNQGDQNEHIEPQRFAQSSKPLDSTNYALKIEGNIGNSQGLNPSRNLLGVLGINPDHHQYNHGGASGNTWIDSSSFSTTSSTHNLL